MNFKIKKLIDSTLVLSFSTLNLLFYFTPDPQQDKFCANYIAMVLFMRVRRIASLRKHVTTIANIVVQTVFAFQARTAKPSQQARTSRIYISVDAALEYSHSAGLCIILTVDPLNKKALLRMATITQNFFKSLDVVLPFFILFFKIFYVSCVLDC